MRHRFFIFACLFLVFSCGGQPSHLKTVSSIVQLDDFFVVEATRTQQSNSTPRSSCREKIAQIICITAERPTDLNTQPICLPGGEQYAVLFEEIYDRFPKNLQRMFCSLSQIYILEKFVGTAFAGTVDPATGNITSAVIGFRRSIIDERLNLKTWATWKEQLSFGGDTDSYRHPLPELPYIETATDVPINDFLYFVVAHEFGHIFDFTNHVNKTIKVPHSDGEPELFTEDSWGAIGWSDTFFPKPESRFSYRLNLCFYFCNGEAMTKEAVPELYRGLAHSNFISTYGATNAFDEFADTLAYYLLDKNGYSYELHTGQGESYDIMAKLNSQRMAGKHQYIKDFLARSDIIYP